MYGLPPSATRLLHPQYGIRPAVRTMVRLSGGASRWPEEGTDVVPSSCVSVPLAFGITVQLTSMVRPGNYSPAITTVFPLNDSSCSIPSPTPDPLIAMKEVNGGCTTFEGVLRLLRFRTCPILSLSRNAPYVKLFELLGYQELTVTLRV